jgi:hypothetical protein
MALPAAACSVQQTLGAPSCDDGNSALIVAQSVPTASQVPCLGPLPDGWEVTTVNVNQDRTVVTLDSDRAGDSAAILRFEQRCDTADAVPAPSDQPAADRYDSITSATPSFEGARHYVFPGGCVSWAFDFESGASATDAIAVAGALMLISREDFNATIRESFIDEEI